MKKLPREKHRSEMEGESYQHITSNFSLYCLMYMSNQHVNILWDLVLPLIFFLAKSGFSSFKFPICYIGKSFKIVGIIITSLKIFFTYL